MYGIRSYSKNSLCSELPKTAFMERRHGLNTPFFAPFLASLFGDCYARMAAMRIFVHCVMVECNAGSGWKNSIPQTGQDRETGNLDRKHNESTAA